MPYHSKRKMIENSVITFSFVLYNVLKIGKLHHPTVHYSFTSIQGLPKNIA